MRSGVAPVIVAFAVALLGASAYGAMQISADMGTGNATVPQITAPSVFSHGVSPCGVATSFLTQVREKNFEAASEYVQGRYNDTPGTADRIERFGEIYGDATDVECICAVDALDGNGKTAVFAYTSGGERVYEPFTLEYTEDGWRIDFRGEILRRGDRLTAAGQRFVSRTTCDIWP